MRHNWQRNIKAQIRDARILLQESHRSLLLFFGILALGSFAFHFLYVSPDTGEHLDFIESTYATFTLVFFQNSLPFPDHWYLRILFFIIPILGLGAMAEGILRFWVALIDKQARGQKWQVAMASTYKNHVIVCGLGKVGSQVIIELQKLGREVVVVERNVDDEFLPGVHSQNIPVIIGDARRSITLSQAGVEQADAIITCTDDELTNLDIALDAREANKNIKVVMRLFDNDLARRIEKGFNIHTAFSIPALTAPIFAAAAMRVNVQHSFYVDGKLLIISELVVNPKSILTGWSIGKLERDMDLSVIWYKQNDREDFHPAAEIPLSGGVRILILASLETLQELEKYNQS